MNDVQTPGSGGGGKGLAVAALVLGITAFFPGCCLAGIYGNWVLAILAIVFGVVGMKGAGSGMAKAGLILGIVAIALHVVLLIVGYELNTNLEQWLKEQETAMSGDGGNFDGDFDAGDNDGDNDGGSDGEQSDGGASAPAANDSTDG